MSLTMLVNITISFHSFYYVVFTLYCCWGSIEELIIVMTSYKHTNDAKILNESSVSVYSRI